MTGSFSTQPISLSSTLRTLCTLFLSIPRFLHPPRSLPSITSRPHHLVLPTPPVHRTPPPPPAPLKTQHSRKAAPAASDPPPENVPDRNDDQDDQQNDILGRRGRRVGLGVVSRDEGHRAGVSLVASLVGGAEGGGVRLGSRTEEGQEPERQRSENEETNGWEEGQESVGGEMDEQNSRESCRGVELNCGPGDCQLR